MSITLNIHSVARATLQRIRFSDFTSEHIALYDAEGKCLGSISLMTESASAVVDVERLPDQKAHDAIVNEPSPAEQREMGVEP